MRKGIIAVDAGGQSFKSCVVDWETLTPVTPLVFEPIDSGAERNVLLGSFKSIVSQALHGAADRDIPVCGVAFSCPGPMDYHNGISLMDHKWPHIKGASIPEFLYENLLDRSIPVTFCHDGNSLILGQIAAGVTKSSRSIAGYIIGTGLGFGIIKDGEMQNDERGVPKFALFKRPYRDSSLELFVASKGIPALYNEISKKSVDVSAKDVAQMAFAGDRAAIEAYEMMGRILAETSYDILADYEVDCIIFGGRISDSFDLFGPSFQKVLKKHGVSVQLIIRAEQSETIAMQGAAYHAKYNR